MNRLPEQSSQDVPCALGAGVGGQSPFNRFVTACRPSVNLTDSPSEDALPIWSPDGTRITFESERDGDAKVYIMNADGSSLNRLTDSDWPEFRQGLGVPVGAALSLPSRVGCPASVLRCGCRRRLVLG